MYHQDGIDWECHFEELEEALPRQLSEVRLNTSEGDGPSEGSSGPKEADIEEMRLMQTIRQCKWIFPTENDGVQGECPKSPIYSPTTFASLCLDPNLLRGVYDMGYNVPSKIQKAALPRLLANPPKNMIAQSQSGTGKTAAFVLAMLSRVDPNKKYPQVVCLSPTVELAKQTGDVATRLGKFCLGIQICHALRGTIVAKRTRLRQQIIIGTPGKVLDWALKFKFFELSKLTVFVLDEADVMLSIQGHREQCVKLQKGLSQTCQIMLFSATYDQNIFDFAGTIVPDPSVIRLGEDEQILDNIREYYVECSGSDEKYAAIANIYGTVGVGQVIIFCEKRTTTSWLATKMSGEGHEVAVLNADLPYHQRSEILESFRRGLKKVLISTNMMSRGIDVPQVTIVVNFDMPVDPEGRADYDAYLHRIGRTGRFGKTGLAINLVDSPKSTKILSQIQIYFKRQIIHLNANDCDEIRKIAALLLCPTLSLE